MNLIQISERFPTEESCYYHAERVRWQGGKAICPHCDSPNVGVRHKDLRYRCLKCERNFSVITNTLLGGSRLPLKKWFYAIALVTDAKKGISAKQLERNLGVTYKTAWRIGMVLRKGMAIENEGIELDGLVEMDETYVGGKPRKPNVFGLTREDRQELDAVYEKYQDVFSPSQNAYKKKYPAEKPKRGRGTKKTPVVGMVSRDGNVVAKVMTKLTHKELRKMVEESVNSEEAILITDTFKGYNKMEKIIEHVQIDHTKMYSYRGINTNTIESFWAIIKRGIIGQYHHASLKYLPDYVTEFVYKYNNRKDNDLMFQKLLRKCLSTQN